MAMVIISDLSASKAEPAKRQAETSELVRGDDLVRCAMLSGKATLYFATCQTTVGAAAEAAAGTGDSRRVRFLLESNVAGIVMSVHRREGHQINAPRLRSSALPGGRIMMAVAESGL